MRTNWPLLFCLILSVSAQAHALTDVSGSSIFRPLPDEGIAIHAPRLRVLPLEPSLPDSATRPAFTFSLVSEPEGYFVPGDEVRFAFIPVADQPATDSFTLAVALPPGLVLTDVFWEQRGAIARRKLGPPTLPEAFPVGIITRIDEGFTGRTLTVSGGVVTETSGGNESAIDSTDLAAFPSVTISVAKILSSVIDTCFFARDSSGGQVRTIVATRRKLTAQLRGPVDLSPTGPLRVSHRVNDIFALWPGKKKKKKKKKRKATALHYVLSEENPEDYPPRYTPEKKKTGKVDFVTRGRPGDSLLVSVKTIKGRPLRSITLTDETEEILDAVADVPGYNFSVVQDTAFLVRTLHLRARRLFGIIPLRQYALVDAERRPVIRKLFRQNGSGGELPDDIAALLPDTCAGNFDVMVETVSSQTKTWVATDTLLLQAVDATGSVVGKRNLMGNRSGREEINIPLSLDTEEPDTKNELFAVAYWVGVGAPSISAYDALAEEVPPEWSQPGVSAPLAAYGLSYPVNLPGLGASEETVRTKLVRYDFTGPGGDVVISRSTAQPNFGVVRGDDLGLLSKTAYDDPETGKRLLHFYLDYRNQHAINTYSVRVQVVAFYRVYTLQDVWQDIKP